MSESNFFGTSNRYCKLSTLKLTEVQLRQYHYPRPHPRNPRNAHIYDIESSFYKIIPGLYKRNCKRCSKIYDIDRNGIALTDEQCHNHPCRFGPRSYRCCQGGKFSKPCTKSPRHSSEDIDPNNLNDFVTTKGNWKVTSKGIYALDCEMVITKAGLELACISVVDDSCKVVYETMVLPDNPILDYNTFHSNLTSQDFHGVTTTLKHVQQELLALCGEKTILIGHSLNNDFLMLKLFHDNVVDTIVAYPHSKGGRFRNSLTYLQERYLPGSLIVQSKIAKCRGDARASMKLALMKCGSSRANEMW